MSAVQPIENLGQETATSNALAGRLKIEASKSALLEETRTREPFSTFFVATSIHGETWRGESDSSRTEIDVWATFALKEETTRRAVAMWPTEESAQDPDLEVKSSNDRITLLARKYIAKEQFSDEEKARLAIVTERIRQLMPAATAKEFESLEEVLGVVKRIADSNSAIQASIGIAQKKSA